jgi:predicted DNA-binding transcriptional regulator AlpA
MISLEQRQNFNQHAVVFIFSNRVDSVTVILISTKMEITLMSETTLKRLNIRMVEERLCCHRMTIYRWYTAGTFPKPHYLGQNRLWLEAQVEEWERKQLLEHNSSADTFYTMSGSSPPNVTSSEGGAK